MAKIVLGIGTSHTPQLSVPWEKWDILREKDEADPRLDYEALLRKAKPDIEQELTPEKWKTRYEACQRGLETISKVLADAAPDVVVVIGDDQHEQFKDDNMPMFCLYRGSTMTVRRHVTNAAWSMFEEGLPETSQEYPSEPRLADHMIRHLVKSGFDIACSNHLREDIGLGHAFTFLYRKLLRNGRGAIPMLPVMSNTFYPPNQPTPTRCYELGQALADAIESWDQDARVAVMASGGLSHTVIDEEIDRAALDALARKDRAALCQLPVERMTLGTSEIRNWITAGAAVEKLDMKLIDYVPCYRSPAGTGCGMAFAYWK